MQEELKKKIKEVLEKLQLPDAVFSVDVIEDEKMGDYATNVAMVLAKQVGKNLRALAEEIKTELENLNDKSIEKIEVAGPGFINFFLKPEVFVKNIEVVLGEGDDYGRGRVKGTYLVEHSQANLFKAFHIGHVMNNTIGVSLARLAEFSGAQVSQINYQGDVGLHVAKTIFAMSEVSEDVIKNLENSTAEARANALGGWYAKGNEAYESNDARPQKINEINKLIYSRTDSEINRLYDIGRDWSLEYFDNVFKALDTKFEERFYERQMVDDGVRIVKENIGKVFEESDGAVVFKGEKYGLHTRVFITKEHVPTYEGKEIGYLFKKFALKNPDVSIIITGNEQNDYFRVVLKAAECIDQSVAKRTKQFGHGMLRLPTGKMSSRTGNVLDISKLFSLAQSKLHENYPDMTPELMHDVSLGAIRFSILRQAIGKDIIFDFDKSLSFEGDSGPYLQYTHARIKSVIAKAGEIVPKVFESHDVGKLEKIIAQFPEIALRAAGEFAPQYIVTYLLELASAFNAYYAQNKIIDPENKEESEHRLALALATAQVIKNGLWLLGIKAPERM